MAANSIIQPIHGLPARLDREVTPQSGFFFLQALGQTFRALRHSVRPSVRPKFPALRQAGGGTTRPLRQVSPPARPTPIHRPRTVLAIGAHPDDVEIGCGGTLSRHAARGDDLIILTLSRGGSAGDVARRTAEARAAARSLGADLVMGELEDTQITEGPDTIGQIEQLVEAFSPDIVYTHSASDRHQDHRAVHQATLVATRRVPTVCCYESPSTTQEFRPTRFVDVSSHLETKLNLLAEFGSQGQKDYLAPDLVRSTARYWGRFAAGGVVEPFEVIRERVED